MFRNYLYEGKFWEALGMKSLLIIIVYLSLVTVGHPDYWTNDIVVY